MSLEVSAMVTTWVRHICPAICSMKHMWHFIMYQNYKKYINLNMVSLVPDSPGKYLNEITVMPGAAHGAMTKQLESCGMLVTCLNNVHTITVGKECMMNTQLIRRT